MSIKVNSGRQEVIAAEIDLAYSDLESGTQQVAAYVPRGAILLSSFVAVTEAFNSATSDSLEIEVGYDDDDNETVATGVDLQSAGVTEFDLTGTAFSYGAEVKLTWTGAGAAPDAGEIRLVVQYIVQGRAAFTHGPDYQAGGRQPA